MAALAGGLLSAAAVAQNADLRIDAADRTSRMAAAGAGWDKGFFISDGGANTLKPYGFTQFRYLANFRDDDGVGDQADFTQGFQMRRTRIGAKGTIWSKSLSYDIIGEFSRSTGTFALVDGWGQYKFENGVAVRWGQFKVPFLREELVSDTKQLAAERSTFDQTFSFVRSQGVQVGMEKERFRGWIELSDGGNAINTDFTAAAEADYGIDARGEFRWGDDKDFSRFDDLTSFRGAKNGGLVGAAIHFQDGGETGFTADTAIWSATVDAAFEGDGWNVFAAGVWRNVDPAGGASTDDFGFLVQGGIFVSDQLEPFARYDAVFADDANGDDVHTLTAGLNYYLSPASHAVKFTGDVAYNFDNEGASGIVSPTTSTGLLADTEDGQVVLRLQMQVLF